VERKTINKNRGKIFVICGPSGTGKTTLLGKLIKGAGLKTKILKSISLTTRPKRPGEKTGKDYFFVSRQEFARLLKAKKILEWTRYLGYYYGTPKEFVDSQLSLGRHLGFCLDLKGARALKKAYPQQTRVIFIKPPSIEALKHRIEGRCRSADKNEVLRRLRLARQELKASRSFDYCILNTNLNTAIKKLKRIVLCEILS